MPPVKAQDAVVGLVHRLSDEEVLVGDSSGFFKNNRFELEWEFSFNFSEMGTF